MSLAECFVAERIMMHRCPTPACVAIACAFTACLPQLTHAEGFVAALARRFADSEFEFMRAQSNAPLPPLAWASLTGYENVQVTHTDSTVAGIEFQQTSLSEGAFLPIPIGSRDALVIGEWISLSELKLAHSDNELDVLSVSVPVGWIRQASDRWQWAAFVAPLGHKSEHDDWYWETLGGAFARRLQSDRFAWIVGFYFDVAPLEDFYTPYLGAAYVINDRWTLNAIMPWPSITYAPTPDVFFRLGVAPSGASWTLEAGERRPRVSLDSWNLGFRVETRVVDNVWVGIEGGVSGLRGLSFIDDDWQGLDVDLDETPYAMLTVGFRPNPNPSRAR
jgi:hypothetical protein